MDTPRVLSLFVRAQPPGRALARAGLSSVPLEVGEAIFTLTFSYKLGQHVDEIIIRIGWLRAAEIEVFIITEGF